MSEGRQYTGASYRDAIDALDDLADFLWDEAREIQTQIGLIRTQSAQKHIRAAYYDLIDLAKAEDDDDQVHLFDMEVDITDG